MLFSQVYFGTPAFTFDASATGTISEDFNRQECSILLTPFSYFVYMIMCWKQLL